VKTREIPGTGVLSLSCLEETLFMTARACGGCAVYDVLSLIFGDILNGLYSSMWIADGGL